MIYPIFSQCVLLDLIHAFCKLLMLPHGLWIVFSSESFFFSTSQSSCLAFTSGVSNLLLTLFYYFLKLCYFLALQLLFYIIVFMFLFRLYILSHFIGIFFLSHLDLFSFYVLTHFQHSVWNSFFISKHLSLLGSILVTSIIPLVQADHF